MMGIVRSKDREWKKCSIITVLLDLDHGKVEYFCDDKKIKEDNVNQEAGPFYFALCIHSYKGCGQFESIGYHSIKQDESVVET